VDWFVSNGLVEAGTNIADGFGNETPFDYPSTRLPGQTTNTRHWYVNGVAPNNPAYSPGEGYVSPASLNAGNFIPVYEMADAFGLIETYNSLLFIVLHLVLVIFLLLCSIYQRFSSLPPIPLISLELLIPISIILYHPLQDLIHLNELT